MAPYRHEKLPESLSSEDRQAVSGGSAAGFGQGTTQAAVGSPVAGSAEDSELDEAVLAFFRRIQKYDAQDATQAARQKRISELEQPVDSNKPGEEPNTEDTYQMGLPGKNIRFTDETMSTNMKAPNNPGVKFDAQGGSEIRSGGQQLKTDVKIPSVLFGDKVVNPRFQHTPTNVVSHYPPMILQPPRWVSEVIRVILVPLNMAQNRIENR